MRAHFFAATLGRLLIAVTVAYPGGSLLGAQGAPDVSPSAWVAPADIDQTVPAVRTDIACPLPLLLQGASERVQELVTNLHQFSAREHIEHIEINRRGRPRRARTSAFNYVAQIHQGSGSPSVEEYRASMNPVETSAGEMVDTGTAAFALIFHPHFIEQFGVSCEGLSDLRSRAVWQIHFSQSPNRANLFHVYRVGSNYYPVKLKGRAWIAVDNFEVLRLQTDLVEPVGQIRLLREHTDIQYGAVEFPGKNVRLWLPQSAELYMDLRGHRYQRRHTFTNFRLFSVDTGETVGKPKARKEK